MARSVLVTGGAKRLGAAIARRLAADGWRVAVHYGTSADGAWLLADAEAALGGPLTALVNSASQFDYDSPRAADPALLARLMQVNLATPVALAADLAARTPGDAAIVNLLDQKVGNLNPDYFSYTCTKVALEAATTMMAQAFAPRVRVNAVSPGLTLPSGEQSDAEFDAVARANLLGRPVGEERVADAVAWLLDAEAVTGQNVFVDMGQRLVKRDSDVMFDTVSRP